jgi:isoleucyl-tRNA synthetase
VGALIAVIEQARYLRGKAKISVKHPLAVMKLVSAREGFRASMEKFLSILKEEINVEDIVF